MLLPEVFLERGYFIGLGKGSGVDVERWWGVCPRLVDPCSPRCLPVEGDDFVPLRPGPGRVGDTDEPVLEVEQVGLDHMFLPAQMAVAEVVADEDLDATGHEILPALGGSGLNRPEVEGADLASVARGMGFHVRRWRRLRGRRSSRWRNHATRRGRGPRSRSR